MNILANNFSIKLFVVFGVLTTLMVTLLNVEAREPINDEDYSLDNDYYDRMKLSSFNLYQLANTNILHTESSNTIKTEEEHKKWLHVQNQVITHYKTKWKLIKVPENKIIVIS